MFCPECNHHLLPITLKSEMFTVSKTPRNGTPQEVVLDYCQHCGGVWSDQGEINFINSGNIQPLVKLLPIQPAPTNADYRFLLCPRDRQSLSLFRQESVPQYLSLLHCAKCDGVWFPQKSVVEFKNAQEVKLNYFKTWKIPLHSIYAILLPLLLLAVVGGGIIFTITGIGQQTDLRSRASGVISKPLAISPQPGEVLISFTTTKEVVTKIKYWQQPREVTETWISATPQKDHTIIIKNLQPYREVFYQIEVVGNEAFTSSVYTYEPKNKQ